LKPRRRKKQSKFKTAYLAGFVFLFAIFWVWKAGEVDRMSRQCSNLERQKKELIETNKTLQIKVERYKSISWIDKKAREYGLTASVKSRLVLHEVLTKTDTPNRSLYARLFDSTVNLFNKIVKR